MKREGLAGGHRAALRGVLWLSVAALTFVISLMAHGEMVFIDAAKMTGIEGWKVGRSYGAGDFYSSNGTPVSTQANFEGGEYAVYARVYTSPHTPADLRIFIGEKRLVVPMQAKVCKFGWVRVASVVLDRGPAVIRVESPTPSAASNHSFAALAFCSTPMDDRVGRIVELTEWLRHELIRLEAPKPAPKTAEEARALQRELRETILDKIGLNPLPPRTPLNAAVKGRIEKEDYVIEKVAYESRPNHVVPALLYLPKDRSKPVPAIISAIGHWSYGKSSKAPQLRGISLAKHGYAVLAVEPVYAWERHIPGNSEGFEPLVSGGTIVGHMAWDMMRGVDYLETRPDIDATRVGVTGASGGGMQTFYAGLADERFDAVMPAVALWSMQELAINFYYSCDNWVPGISKLGGMGQIIAATAPRSFLVMNVDSDYSTSYQCEQLVNGARPFYRLLQAEDRLLHTIEPGPHDYTKFMRENTRGFADRWLKGTGDGFPVTEPDLENELFDEQGDALFVFEGGKIPTEGAETVQSIWSAKAVDLRAKLPKNIEGLPEKLREKLDMPPLPKPVTAVKTDSGYLVTSDPGIEVPVLRIGEGKKAVVWLAESDFATESRRPEVQALARNATVFVVEPRGAGMRDEMYILRHATIVMDRPLVGMWAYDLLSAVDFILAQNEFDGVCVAGCGKEMGLACLLAAIFEGRIESTAVDGMFSSFVQLVGDSSVIPQIPGILRLADVEQLVGAAGADRVRLNNFAKSKWSGALQTSAQPATEFFVEWLNAQ